MTDDPQDTRIAARLSRMKPAEAPKRRRGINPYALSAGTALAGAGVGAWLVLAAPETPAPAPVIETASVSDFQQDALGTEGFRIAKETPPIDTGPKPDKANEARLHAEIDDLQRQIAELNARPVPDDVELGELRSQIEALGAEAKTRQASLDDLQRENIRLQTALETQTLMESDGTLAATQTREEELARERQEAEAQRAAQINSDMVALRGDAAMGDETGTGFGDPGTATGTDGARGDGFRLAGATAATARQAEMIANPSNTVMQGTLIEASLETAISTALAGNVAALVSHDVWSFDMNRVLIPRGSRLYGRYDSDVATGQRRVLIAWDRIVTTDGQSVSLAAYGTDRIGRSGLPGRVRTHFLQRFGTAALISVIGAIPAMAAAKYDDSEILSDTAENLGTDLGDAVNDVMADYLSIPPTISVDQGAVVMIRVDSDIEFY